MKRNPTLSREYLADGSNWRTMINCVVMAELKCFDSLFTIQLEIVRFGLFLARFAVLCYILIPWGRDRETEANPCKFSSSLVCKSNPWTCIACSIKSVKNKRQLVLLSEMWQSFCNKIHRNKLDKWLCTAAIIQHPQTLVKKDIIDINMCFRGITTMYSTNEDNKPTTRRSLNREKSKINTLVSAD